MNKKTIIWILVAIVAILIIYRLFFRKATYSQKFSDLSKKILTAESCTVLYDWLRQLDIVAADSSINAFSDTDLQGMIGDIHDMIINKSIGLNVEEYKAGLTRDQNIALVKKFRDAVDAYVKTKCP